MAHRSSSQSGSIWSSAATFKKPTHFHGCKSSKAPLLRGFFRSHVLLKGPEIVLDSRAQRGEGRVMTRYNHGIQSPDDFRNNGVGLESIEEQPSSSQHTATLCWWLTWTSSLHLASHKALQCQDVDAEDAQNTKAAHLPRTVAT